jgi:amino acid permease
MEHPPDAYPARLEIDYPESLDRLSTLLRIPFIIPILVVAALMPATPLIFLYFAAEGWISGDDWTGGFVTVFFLPLILMLLFRGKYPRWWFDFVLELMRFETRIIAYVSLLTDKYPATDEEQSVHLDLDYPDAKQLNRFLPIIKWLLAIPHYIVLIIATVLALLAIIVAWFAILATGRYPRRLFDYVVGVNRYGIRIGAYTAMLLTDRYPPFRLGA